MTKRKKPKKPKTHYSEQGGRDEIFRRIHTIKHVQAQHALYQGMRTGKPKEGKTGRIDLFNGGI